MSNKEKMYDEFWSKFKAHPMTKKYNLKVIESYEDNSRLKTDDNARKILTPCDPDYIFHPDYITVRGNSKGKNYIMCQIRFSKDPKNNIDRGEELLFFDFLDKRIEEVKSELQGGSKSLYNGVLDWRKTKEEGENTTIHLSLYVKDIFDSGEREYYFNWLAHNAEQFLKTFGRYYKEFKKQNS